MNILIFHVLKASRSVQAVSNAELRDFLYYSIYGWLSPAVPVLISLCLHFMNSTPYVNSHVCWIEGIIHIYLFGIPLGMYIIINIILFLKLFFSCLITISICSCSENEFIKAQRDNYTDVDANLRTYSTLSEEHQRSLRSEIINEIQSVVNRFVTTPSASILWPT